jgi:hypothetical protein
MTQLRRFPTNYTLRARIIKLQFLLFDLGISSLSFYIGLIIAELIGYLDGFETFLPVLFVLLFLRALTAFLFKTYLIIIRYIGERDIRSAFSAILVSSFFFSFF